jgi:hypothetical protein
MGLLDHRQICRHFDHTEQTCITLRVRTALADALLGEGIAALAMLQARQRTLQGFSQAVGTALVALKQVVSHALRRLRTNARQTAQGLDQGV